MVLDDEIGNAVTDSPCLRLVHTATPHRGSSDTEPPTDTTVHTATVERDGRGWMVQVHGVAGPGRFRAVSLQEAERSATRLIWGYTGALQEIVLDIRLPEVTADRLWLIGEYRRDLEAELQAAFAELTDLWMSGPDIERVFKACLQEPNADEKAQFPIVRPMGSAEA